MARSGLERALGTSIVAELLRDGVANLDRKGRVCCAFAVIVTGESLIALPLETCRPDRVYIGPDSRYLVEAALRLAPSGERAVELGAGAGFLAITLASRYRTVIATDVLPRAAVFVRRALALNRLPQGHRTAVAVGDVAGGLRCGAFDLVAANTPWVPDADGAAALVFATGGRTGVELPMRFIREGAALLRPGGVAITLALDITTSDGGRPLHELSDELAADGLSTALLPTPINHLQPGLGANMLRRQPSLVSATHVAFVVGSPPAGGGPRDSLLIAAEALGRRWAASTAGTGDRSRAGGTSLVANVPRHR